MFKLRSTAVDSKYVWAILNGKLLMPDVDYSVTEDQKYIKFVSTLKDNDRIEVFHFGYPTVISILLLTSRLIYACILPKRKMSLSLTSRVCLKRCFMEA